MKYSGLIPCVAGCRSLGEDVRGCSAQQSAVLVPHQSQIPVLAVLIAHQLNVSLEAGLSRKGDALLWTVRSACAAEEMLPVSL